MTTLKTILLAEDDPRDQELTLAVLGQQNLVNEVAVANDGEEALDYLYRRGKFSARQEGNPAVVVLDLKMPKVDGLEVLKQIRSDPQLKTLPVVILSSSREEGDLRNTYDLGVNAYVVKPVDFREFSNKVKQLGLFWATTNEPPPASTKSRSRV
ncbi:MAG: response regulator [bacterium]